MGYKIKLFFGRKYDTSYLPENPEAKWFYDYAMIDLGKVSGGAVYDLCKSSTSETPKVYMYADDGNREILKDWYDKPLGLCSLEDMEKALECEIILRYGCVNRRLLTALAMVKSFKNKDLYPEGISIVTFGH